MLSRVFLSVLLIAAVLSGYNLTSGELVQQATVTNLQTVTTLATNSGFTTTATSYVTTIVQQPPLYSTTVSIAAVPQQYSCEYNSLQFTATQGERVTGHFKATGAITFHILNEANYASWVAGTSCSTQGLTALFSEEGTLGASFDLQIPADGGYRFLFLNPSHGTDVLVDFYAQAGETSTTTTLALPILETVTGIFVVTSTETLSSTHIENAFSILQDQSLTLIVAAAVAVLGSFVVLMRRRKAPSSAVIMKGPEPPPQTQPLEVVPPPTARELSTGYGDLDRLLAGGLPEGYTILILSPPCDERDLLLRKIIGSAVASDRPTFYVSSDLGKIQDLVSRYWKDFYVLSPQADRIVSPPANLYKIAGIENLSDLNISLTKSLEPRIRERRAGRLFIIDVLTDTLLHHKALTTRKWLSDFLARRKGEDFTILAFLNPLVTPNEETQSLIDLFDGVIEIYEKETREKSRRFLVVKKMYGRKYSENELMLDKDKLF